MPATDPAACGETMPHPTQGSVDASGKFVYANPTKEFPRTPTSPNEWSDSAYGIIQKTGEHTLRIGLVQCDSAARVITIPAQVNAREGMIEYAMVTKQGKIHESLLATAADPVHVQMAALLLGMSPQPGKPEPCEVKIEVEWATNGPPRKMPLEDLIALAMDTPHNPSGTTLTRGPWMFTGSRIDRDGFVAVREGSIITLIGDPAALIGNPRPGRENDSLHVPNARLLPATGMPVNVRIHLKTSAMPDVKTPAKP